MAPSDDYIIYILQYFGFPAFAFYILYRFVVNDIKDLKNEVAELRRSIEKLRETIEKLT